MKTTAVEPISYRCLHDLHHIRRHRSLPATENRRRFSQIGVLFDHCWSERASVHVQADQDDVEGYESRRLEQERVSLVAVAWFWKGVQQAMSVNGILHPGEKLLNLGYELD